jgi:hypothetical protein
MVGLIAKINDLVSAVSGHVLSSLRRAHSSTKMATGGTHIASQWLSEHAQTSIATATMALPYANARRTAYARW